MLGVLAALAGLEHGVGALLQDADQTSLVFESWPDAAAFEPLSGEPAMSLVGDLRVAGVLTILVALALGWWTLRMRITARDALVLVGLSIMLLLVGGGFGPPLIGLLLGTWLLRQPSVVHPLGHARRALARRWRGLLTLTAAAFLALFPGVVLLGWAGVESVWLPAVLPFVAFGGLVLTLVGASACDRLDANHDPGGGSP